MTYTADSLILGIGKATAAQIDRWFEIMGRSLAPRYAPDNTYRPAPDGIGQMMIDAARLWPQSVNHDLLAAQVIKEAAAWQSKYARHRNNPSGMGAINSDPDQAVTFATPQEGLRATVAHLLTYVSGTGAWTEHDPRASATPAQWQGAVRRLRDLDGKWAYPGNGYGAGIARLANELLGVEAGEMLTLRECLIPAERNNRPEIALKPTYITIHETANTNAGADAEAHCRYIRSDAAALRPASWHVTVDDHSGYQHLPYNEVAWHAGDGSNGTGNRSSLSIELCVNRDGNWQRTMENAATVVRGWMDSYSIPIQNVVQHNHWSDTSCPAKMRAGSWPTFLAMLQDDPQPLVVNGYELRGPIRGTYLDLQAHDQHWATFGVPVGGDVPGVVVDGEERIVQPFDRAGWIMVEGDRAVVAKPEQVRQINRELGIDNGTDIRLPALREHLRDAERSIGLALSEVAD